MDIVFDQSFAVKGEDIPIKLSFKDIIFVMEDVDAASPIVQTRCAENSNEKVVAADTSDSAVISAATDVEGTVLK